MRVIAVSGTAATAVNDMRARLIEALPVSSADPFDGVGSAVERAAIGSSGGHGGDSPADRAVAAVGRADAAPPRLNLPVPPSARLCAVTHPALDAVGLIVADLPRSVSFYRRLGVPFPEGAERSEHGHAEANLAGGFRLMLDTEASVATFDPAWRAPVGEPRASVAFRCASPADVDALYAEANEAGGHGHREPWDAFWGQRYAQLRDPDGNGVDLYADLRGTG